MNSSFPRGITAPSNFEPPPCVGCVDFTTLAVERSKPAQLRAEDTARAVYFTVRAKKLNNIVFKKIMKNVVPQKKLATPERFSGFSAKEIKEI